MSKSNYRDIPWEQTSEGIIIFMTNSERKAHEEELWGHTED